MNQSLSVFDPTAQDSKSKVRGVGRYVSLMKDSFPSWHFGHPSDSPVFINPFINLLSPPSITKRYAKRQIGVIYDLIPLKHPAHFPAGLRGTISLIRNRLAFSTYDHFVTDSQTAKQDMVDILHIPSEKITVIYPYVKKYITTPCNLPTTPYYLYVGDATWNKNLVNIAKAVQMSTTPCVFVGNVFTSSEKVDPSNVWNDELIQFMQMTRNNNLFLFPGYVKDEELAYLYQNTLGNILVSRDEGFGFSYAEASAYGTASLLADRSIFHETAVDSALFCDPESPQSIHEGLQKIGDEKIRGELKIKALQRSKVFNQIDFIKGWKTLVE